MVWVEGMNAGILTKTRAASLERLMPRQQIGRPVATKAVRALLLLLIAGIGASLPNVCANASTAVPSRPAGNGHNGNGKHSKNDISVNSPTFNRGIQHTNNGNVGGKYITANVFCKARRRSCKVIQKIVVRR